MCTNKYCLNQICTCPKNVVDLLDFVILGERRLENLNICMSQNMVDLVDFVFHSQRRLEISNICMSQKGVDLVDLGFPLVKAS